MNKKTPRVDPHIIENGGTFSVMSPTARAAGVKCICARKNGTFTITSMPGKSHSKPFRQLIDRLDDRWGSCASPLAEVRRYPFTYHPNDKHKTAGNTPEDILAIVEKFLKEEGLID